MITESIHALATTAREAVKSWRSMLVLAAIYALLLATVYALISTREASIFQVAVTFTLAVAAPVLFFILQAAAATYAYQLQTKALVQRALKDWGKLLIVSLPLILLTVVLLYVLGRVQARFGATLVPPAEIVEQTQPESETQPLIWSAVLINTLRYLLIGLVLPLTLMHLWLAVTREGLMMTFKRITYYITRAFAPESVFIYIAGFLVFALIPYLLIFRIIRVNSAFIEIGLLVAKLAVVFALSLFGWVVTMGALQHANKEEWQNVSPGES